MMKSPIRVLIVDDSAIARKILERIISSSPELLVVGTAANGIDALEMIPRVRPDVICADLHMPKMDGIEFTKEVMALYAIPILIISISVARQNTGNVFKMLEAGAIDVFPKPSLGLESEYLKISKELISRIKVLAGVKPVRRKRREEMAVEETPLPKKSHALIKPEKTDIVVIGASTGGPQVLLKILPRLPHDFPVPVVVVQHIGEGFLQSFMDWMAAHCRIKLVRASAGESPLPGKVYFPPENTHLALDEKGRFDIISTPPLNGHRPSISVTMTSFTGRFGKGTVGILLTGMGNDGADGMLRIAESGGTTIAQDERSSIVFGMPKQAIEMGAAQYVLSPEEIADFLLAEIHHGKKVETRR